MDEEPKTFARPVRPHRRRAFVRHSVTIPARLFAPDMSKSVDCVLRDISQGGALVAVAADAFVPDRFYLWQQNVGAMVRCEVQWRRHDIVGLKFIGDHEKVQALVACCLPERESRVIPFGGRRSA
jgi:hypothetical protein